MYVSEFRKSVTRCEFLLDWQKEAVLAMVNDEDDEDETMDDATEVVDNVFWRTMGVRLCALPVQDGLSVRAAIREITG